MSRKTPLKNVPVSVPAHGRLKTAAELLGIPIREAAEESFGLFLKKHKKKIERAAQERAATIDELFQD
ncbi:MAG: hypothetical protein RL885_11570 [Planctomycetota bacterium]